MKALNVFLMIVLILMLAFGAYFLIGGSLKTEVSIATAPAAEHLDACVSIQNIINSNAAPQQFTALPSTPESCTLMDINLSLTNAGLFDAEWIDVSVAPAEGDIAVYSLTGESSTVPARSVGQINLKLITTTPSAPRKITLNYYVFGMMREIAVEA